MRALSIERSGAVPQAIQGLDRLDPAGRPTAAIVDLDALVHNLGVVRERAGKRRILAVVKAQAYGHGALPVARRLVEAGVDMLGVALVEEGRELREAGVTAPVLIMGTVTPAQADEIVRFSLVPTITSIATAAALSSAASRRGTQVEVHVKVDTGMGRIGVAPDRAPDFVAEVASLGAVRVQGIMTHFSDADLRDKEFATLQVRRFEDMLAQLAARGISVPERHAANSAAVLDYPNALFTMVRPGLMLYGYDPLEQRTYTGKLLPVLSLATRIAFLKRVPAGTPISYGRTYVTARESLIATIPVGYADGYSRSLSNRGEMLVRGRRVPVVGRVCMDMTMIDVTDVDDVREGDVVVLIGSNGKERISAYDIAGQTGTIPYDVLCGISGRVPRVYL